MEITNDTTTYVDADAVERNLAYIVPLKVTFRAKDPAVNIRIMDELNRLFKVHQYVKDEEGGTPFTGDWDFFFWCYADCGGRDMHYFYLMVNDRRSAEERQHDYSRLAGVLETRFKDEDCRVCFEFHSKEKHEAVNAEAARIFAELGGKKKWVDYDGRQGRLLRFDNLGYVFMDKGARKKGWRLPPRVVCNIHKWEGEKTGKVA